MFQSPGPIAFSIGPISVHWYGILIGIGILFCYGYIIYEFKRNKLDRYHIDNMAFWLILAGVIGARLYYVLFNLDYFASHPLEILEVWRGGLAIHGALIFGALAFFIYVFRHKLSWLLYADFILPGVLLAQAIGRWGNFFNSEAFGRPTSLPWKLFIPAQDRPAQYADFSYFHPTFLYESLWNLLGFIILALICRYLYSRPHKKTGYVFCGYLIWYSIGRFFIESLRTDSLYVGSLRTAQIVSVILFAAGAALLIFLIKKPKIHT